MSHLGAACEDGHYTGYTGGSIGSAITVDTTSGHFLSPNRCGLAVAGNGSTGVMMTKNLTTASSSFWLGVRAWLNSSQSAGVPFINLCSPSGRVLISIQSNSGLSSDVWQVSKVRSDGATSLLFVTSAGFSVTPGIPDKIDLQTVYGSSGSITLYINGVQVGSYSGDVTWDDSTTQIGSVQIGSPTSRTSVSLTWSGLFMSTEPTLSRDAYFRPPASAGDLSQWTGGVANVGNETVSSSVYDTVATTLQTQLYKPSAVAPAGQIVRVVDVIQAAAGTSPPFANLQFVRKIAGTTYNSANQALPAATGVMEFSRETNPATGVAWTTSDVNASTYQLGYESAA